MENTADAVRRLWMLCNVLRDDGITYHEYLGELTYLLFLKMADELGIEQDIPVEFRWNTLSGLPASEALEQYRSALATLGKSENQALCEIFEQSSTQIRHEHAFARLMQGISSIDWYSANRDGVGDIYEGLIEKNATESRYGAGQYFTPRALVDAMVTVTRPRKADRIYDPAAGTAGFLIAAGLRANSRGESSPILLGRELVRDVQRMALMNLRLHGLIGDVSFGDTLSINSNEMNVSLCLTNPPFGVKSGLTQHQQDLLDYPTSNKQLAFIQHIYKSLAPKGRAAVVVPDNVLFESGVAGSVRTHLLDNFNLHTILTLPTGIFYATGVKTSVLFFSNTGPTTKTWFYNLRANGNGYSKRRQLGSADLQPFIDSFGPDPLKPVNRVVSEYFQVQTRQQLRSVADRLDHRTASSHNSDIGTTNSPLELVDLVIQELEQALVSARGIAQAFEGSQTDASNE